MADSNNGPDLGKAFKQFREARGFTLKEAGFGTSVSALSRFEHDQTNLNNHALNTVMTNIGLLPDDLRVDFLMFHSPFIKALGNIKALRVGVSLARVKSDADLYQATTADHQYRLRDLNIAVFDWMIKSYEANAELRMPSDLQVQIKHLLIDDNAWYMYDLNIFSFVMDFLDTNLIVRAYQSLRAHEHFKPGTPYADDIAFVMWHVGLALIMRDENELLPTVQEDITRFRDAMTDRQGPLISNLVLALVTEKKEPSAANSARVAKALRAPTMIGMPNLASFCQLLVSKAHGDKAGVII
jgi:transcriptional regulator with XRE-family HTH domain